MDPLDITDIATPAALAEALRSATGPRVLRLQAGLYGSLALRARTWPESDPLRIVAADPCDPPRFSGLRLTEVTGLRLEGLAFDYRFAAGDPTFLRPFDAKGGAGLTLARCAFTGDLARGTGTVADGAATGYGFCATDARRVRVDGCRLSRFMRGMVFSRCDDVVVRGNELFGMRAEGLNFAAVQGVEIERNTIRDFLKAAGSADHPDMIQFWTNGTLRPSTGIVIRNNLLASGRHGWTQSIFMRNDLVDRGLAGPEMHYRDVLIEGNMILNAHAHGITVGETDGLTIRNNTLVCNRLSAGENPSRSVWVPKISVKATSTAVAIRDNIAGGPLPVAGAGWDMTGNLIVQDMDPARPGYTGDLFSGHPAEPDTFGIRSGGPLAGAGAGSFRLRS